MRKILLFLIGLMLGVVAPSVWADAQTGKETYEGVVTFRRQNEPYFFVHAADGRDWRCSPDFTGPGPKVGDIVRNRDAYLETRYGCYTTRSFRGTLEILGHDETLIPEPIVLRISDMFRLGPRHLPEPDYHAKIVYTEGVVYDIIRREYETMIILKDEDKLLRLSILVPLAERLPEGVVLGALVRVRGPAVYNGVFNKDHQIVNIQNVCILMEGFGDIHVLNRPPWWTPTRILIGVGVLLAILLVSWVFVFALRREVVKQAARLADSIRAQHNERLEAEAARRERLRLAADLHDGFQQLLAGTMFRIDAAFGAMTNDQYAAALQQLAGARDALCYTQNGLRAALWSMTEESEGPGRLADLLTYAVRRLPHWQGRVFVSSQGSDVKLPRLTNGSLLMVFQEAVGNALKHGRATRVDVNLVFTEEQLTITITDNGCGFDRATRLRAGLGLTSMERRMAELGGTLSIESALGKGTRVTAILNLNHLAPVERKEASDE